MISTLLPYNTGDVIFWNIDYCLQKQAKRVYETLACELCSGQLCVCCDHKQGTSDEQMVDSRVSKFNISPRVPCYFRAEQGAIFPEC